MAAVTIAKIRKLLKILFRPQLLFILLRYNVAGTVEHLDLLRSIRPRTVVDVGANKGQFAVLMNYLYPEAQVFSFEPLAAPCRVFHKVFSKKQNVRLFEAAIGQVEEQKPIFVSIRPDSSSFLKPTKAQVSEFPQATTAGVETVSIQTFKSFGIEPELKAVSLLKVDVQGYELEVLTSIGDDLKLFDWILIEVSFVELYELQPSAFTIFNYLEKYGFELSDLGNLVRDKQGNLMQSDLLFKRK